VFLISGGEQIDGGNAGAKVSEAHYNRLLSPMTLKSIAFAPTLGNHDLSANFNRHFNLPNLDQTNGLSADGKIAGNYYYTYGNVLIMHLNSNNVNTAQHRAFMLDAVSKNPDTEWKIAVMHHCAYGVGPYGDDASRRLPFSRLMDEFKIDVVLNGHDHIYSRSLHMFENAAQQNQFKNEKGQIVNPAGTVYVTANSSSGSKYYASKGKYTAHNSFQYQSNTPNISKVDITQNSFTISTYRSANKAADGEFILIDTYSILKIK
jgi:3',5'-cyclic AMP phosphodiesterase CpdA